MNLEFDLLYGVMHPIEIPKGTPVQTLRGNEFPRRETDLLRLFQYLKLSVFDVRFNEPWGLCGTTITPLRSQGRGGLREGGMGRRTD